VNRSDFQTISRLRLREAKELYKVKLPSGAYYLAGYSIECALKACISKETARFDFPEKKRVNDSHTHNLESLLRLAFLDQALKGDRALDPVLDENWRTVSSWTEESRYRVFSLTDAHDILEAAGNRFHGVLPWIKRYW
jgi:hypothetical protein